eukprot:1038399-Amphidinium_carterae.1
MAQRLERGRSPLNKSAGKGTVANTNLKGSKSSPVSPQVKPKKGAGKATQTRQASSERGGGSSMGFPTQPTFTPMALPYTVKNPFVTPFLKLHMDMQLIAECVPKRHLPHSHLTLTTPFQFYSKQQ